MSIVSPAATLCFEQYPSMYAARTLLAFVSATRVNCQSRAPGLAFSRRMRSGSRSAAGRVVAARTMESRLVIRRMVINRMQELLHWCGFPAFLIWTPSLLGHGRHFLA